MPGMGFAFQHMWWGGQNRKYPPYPRNGDGKVCSWKSLADFLDINKTKQANLESGKRMESHPLEAVCWASQPWLLVSCLLLNQFLACKDIFPSWVVSCICTCHFPTNIHSMPTSSLPKVIKLPFDRAENIFCFRSSSQVFGSVSTPSLRLSSTWLTAPESCLQSCSRPSIAFSSFHWPQHANRVCAAVVTVMTGL